MAAAMTQTLPVLPNGLDLMETAPVVVAAPLVLAGPASPTGQLVVTPVHSPASLGLSSFMRQSWETPQNSRPMKINDNLMAPTQAPTQTHRDMDVCPGDAVCGSMPHETLTRQMAPVVQTVQHAGRRVRETACDSTSMDRIHSYTAPTLEAVSTCAVQGVTAVNDVGHTIEPYVDAALTKYCLPACVAVRDVHTEYVVPSVTRVRHTYNEQCHHQYVVPTVTKAGELVEQARTTYMEQYHQQYVVHSLNRAVDAVGQLPQTLSAAMQQKQHVGIHMD